jgi:hypothetical protein
MTARRAGHVRRGVGCLAIAVFLGTAFRSVSRMGPVPDGTCATAPTCPNSHQWVALLVMAAICVVFAFLTFVVVYEHVPNDGEAGRLRPWPDVAIAVAVAVALVIVAGDPPGHLNSPHADWFGRSLADSSLN